MINPVLLTDRLRRADYMIPQQQIHPFPPVYNKRSRILILGSFPSVRSRETRFYYGHPQNRFWPLLARLYGERTPSSIDERKIFALQKGIALWDSIRQCDIAGSSDASIRNVIPNDIAGLVAQSGITRIYCNGKQAFDIYRRYCLCTLPAIPLPSTSAANAAWTMERLAEAWKIILE